jgi:hypothetical protein
MSKIVNLTRYDLVFTTSFYIKHGVSGHIYEMIDYYYICKQAGINCGILLSDGTDRNTFRKAIEDKYTFTKEEVDDFLDNTTECHRPKLVMTNNMCIVDGSAQVLDCIIYADNMLLLRCSEWDLSYFSGHKTIKRTHVLQDFKLYPERYTDLELTVVDYTKKLLLKKCARPAPVKTNTALLYLTTNCRAIPVEDVRKIISKQICDNYLVVTNYTTKYAELAADNVFIEQAPVTNIFERFDTYVYTPTDQQSDCSPRFIVECNAFGKTVVYEIDYLCAGLERRKEDIANRVNLELTEDDYFVEYVKGLLND